MYRLKKIVDPSTENTTEEKVVEEPKIQVQKTLSDSQVEALQEKVMEKSTNKKKNGKKNEKSKNVRVKLAKKKPPTTTDAPQPSKKSTTSSSAPTSSQLPREGASSVKKSQELTEEQKMQRIPKNCWKRRLDEEFEPHKEFEVLLLVPKFLPSFPSPALFIYSLCPSPSPSLIY